LRDRYRRWLARLSGVYTELSTVRQGGAMRGIGASLLALILHLLIGTSIPQSLDSNYILGQMPSARVYSSLVLVNQGITAVCFGGYATDGSVLNDVYLYDTRMQQWKSLQMSLVDSNTNAIPIARAEHAAAAVGTSMFVFGGLTKKYGNTQDLWSFDVTTLRWIKINTYASSSIPERRAGHAMTSGPNENIYLFGGRASYAANQQSAGAFVGLSDMWVYNVVDNTWIRSPQGMAYPAGRQHAAIAYMNEIVYVFGGVDPASNYTYNDVWAWHTGFMTWQQLSPNSGSILDSIAPPSLHSAHLIPIPLSSKLLIYGGVGGGGSCSGKMCQPLETDLGQLYSLSINEAAWSSGHIFQAAESSELLHIQNIFWQSARLTAGAHVYHGRLRKRFGFEEVVFDSARNLIYELGGAQPIPLQAIIDNQNALGIDAAQPVTLDSGSGILQTVLWDAATGLELEQREQLPTNSFWQYSDGFSPFSYPTVNETVLLFPRALRTYQLSANDIVLVQVMSCGP
jgi:N-acetylneuraminic acid mutarotase